MDKNVDVKVSGTGCGLALLGICLLFVLTSEMFWAGLRSVLEAMK